MKVLERRFGYGVTLSAIVLGALAVFGATQFRPVSQWFPMMISVATALLGLLVLCVDVIAERSALKHSPLAGSVPLGNGPVAAGPAGDVPEDEATSDEAATTDTDSRGVLLGFVKYMAWISGFAVLLVLIGMPLAVPLWMILFIRIAAKESYLYAGISAAAMTTLLFFVAALLDMAFPVGVLIDSGAIIPSWRF